MDPAERERDAEEVVGDLRRAGMSRDGIHQELVGRGLTPDEADDLLDGRGLPGGGTHRILAPDAPPTVALSPGIRALAPGPSGIAGWLLLPAIGLILSPFGLWDAIQELRTTAATTDLPQVEAMYPGMTVALQLELAANVGLLVLTVVAAFFFFRKRRLARWVMIALFAARGSVEIADEVCIAQLLSEAVNPRVLFEAFGFCALWIAYFLRSERVKNTFVR